MDFITQLDNLLSLVKQLPTLPSSQRKDLVTTIQEAREALLVRVDSMSRSQTDVWKRLNDLCRDIDGDAVDAWGKDNVSWLAERIAHLIGENARLRQKQSDNTLIELEGYIRNLTGRSGDSLNALRNYLFQMDLKRFDQLGDVNQLILLVDSHTSSNWGKTVSERLQKLIETYEMTVTKQRLSIDALTTDLENVDLKYEGILNWFRLEVPEYRDNRPILPSLRKFVSSRMEELREARLEAQRNAEAARILENLRQFMIQRNPLQDTSDLQENISLYVTHLENELKQMEPIEQKASLTTLREALNTARNYYSGPNRPDKPGLAQQVWDVMNEALSGEAAFDLVSELKASEELAQLVLNAYKAGETFNADITAQLQIWNGEKDANDQREPTA